VTRAYKFSQSFWEIYEDTDWTPCLRSLLGKPRSGGAFFLQLETRPGNCSSLAAVYSHFRQPSWSRLSPASAGFFVRRAETRTGGGWHYGRAGSRFVSGGSSFSRDHQLTLRLGVGVVGLLYSGETVQARYVNKHDPPCPVPLAGLLFGRSCVGGSHSHLGRYGAGRGNAPERLLRARDPIALVRQLRRRPPKGWQPKSALHGRWGVPCP
jgi:hypothetical protein